MMCSQFDEFFDGELAPTATTAFLDHLGTCARCQASLRGRMQEAVVVEEAAPIVIPIRRMRYAVVGSVVALAAAAALVWSLRKPPQPSPIIASIGVTLDIEKGSAVMRGSAAHIGDRVHAKATGPLWIYRNDHELVLACPGGAGCHADGADIEITAMGTYQFVSLGSTTIVPKGNYDTDLAAAATARVEYKVETLEVQ